MKKAISLTAVMLLIMIAFSCKTNPAQEPAPAAPGGGGYQTSQVSQPESYVVLAAMKKYTISTSGMKFVPETLTANVGDEITFVIGSTHIATRVDEAVWNANRTTPNGGFNFGEGTFTYVIKASDVGTIYYICPPHVRYGMKGKIVVNPASK